MFPIKELKALLSDIVSAKDDDYKIIIRCRSIIDIIHNLYKKDFSFRSIFDSYFPPGVMRLNIKSFIYCERLETIDLFAKLLMVLANKYGQTKREKTRFVETRNLLVAAVILGMKNKHLIEIGGLNHPYLVEMVSPLSYNAYTNKEYAEKFHQSHLLLLMNEAKIPIFYHTQNFEDSKIQNQEDDNEIIVYSSNTLEHVQDADALLENIHRLGDKCVAYFCFGPIRSHSFYGHHSSYNPTDFCFASSEEYDCFHLYSQKQQFRILKNNYRINKKQISDIEILDLIATLRTSSEKMLNNYNVSDYFRLFNMSRLLIQKLDFFRDSTQQVKSTKRRLYQENPQIGDISARNILAILSVSQTYFESNYSHINISSNEEATHWLQEIHLQ